MPIEQPPDQVIVEPKFLERRFLEARELVGDCCRNLEKVEWNAAVLQPGKHQERAKQRHDEDGNDRQGPDVEIHEY